jgi:hypothetical protein
LKNCGRLFRAYHDELGYVSRQGDFRELYLHEFRDSIRQLEAYKVRKDRTRRILAEAEKAAGRLKDGVPICSTERDYRPGNIIIQDTRIFLIEVDYPVLRPVYEDFAKFLNDLTTLFLGTPWFLLGYQAPRRLQKSFLTGYFGDGAPIDFISLFCAKNLCFRWYRALEALFAGRYRNQFFMPKALYERQIHRVFYREIMAQLRIARRWPEKAAPGTLSGAPELPPISGAGLR